MTSLFITFSVYTYELATALLLRDEFVYCWLGEFFWWVIKKNGLKSITGNSEDISLLFLSPPLFGMPVRTRQVTVGVIAVLNQGRNGQDRRRPFILGEEYNHRQGRGRDPTITLTIDMPVRDRDGQRMSGGPGLPG